MSTTVAVREHGIIFTGERIPAILSDQKTQTRRLVNPQPFESEHKKGVWLRSCGRSTWNSNERMEQIFERGKPPRVREYLLPVDEWLKSFCRFKVGDHLWVREGFRETFDIDDTPVMEYRAGGTRIIDGKSVRHGEHRTTSILPCWRSPLHMPRWASRITLEVTDVRVQRINEISVDDAIAEGISTNPDNYRISIDGEPHKCVGMNPAYAFSISWNAIHGVDAWRRNDWVWAVSFRRITA